MVDPNQPLRICHCLWTGNIGGVERVTTTLALEQNGFDHVEVVFGKSGGPFHEYLHQKAVIPTRILGLKRGYSWPRKLLKKTTAYFDGFDIVHIQAFNPFLLWAATRSRAKVVYTFHSLTELRRKLKRRDRINKRFLEYGIKRYIDGVTTVSEFARQHLHSTHRHVGNIEVIPNCIDGMPEIDPIQREDLGIPKDAFVLLTYGRLVWHKRVDMLLNHLPKALEEQPNLYYIIEGDGPERKKLEESAIELGLEDRVIFPGFADRIFDLIPVADACLFTSHAESFGLVTLECMRQGKLPLVLKDGGGLAEVMGQLASGILVCDDVQQMMMRVEQLQREEPLVELEELHALVNSYSATSISAQYRKFYLRLLNPGS